MERDKAGKNGERLTAEFLRSKGCTVIKMNYHSRFGEIDIIAETKEYIIFTEVKTRAEGSLISPAEAVDAHKRRRLILTAEDFLSKFETELQPRFDVAEVIIDNGTVLSIDYIFNAYDTTGYNFIF